MPSLMKYTDADDAYNGFVYFICTSDRYSLECRLLQYTIILINRIQASVWHQKLRPIMALKIYYLIFLSRGAFDADISKAKWTSS